MDNQNTKEQGWTIEETTNVLILVLMDNQNTCRRLSGGATNRLNPCSNG